MKRLGIIMNGVTGRMGSRQHLVRSILAIRREGGIVLPDGETLWPDPVLVGRDARKLEPLARAHGIERWSTDLQACLADPDAAIYFDARATGVRAPAICEALRAGKHVYVEKPLASDLDTAMHLARLARQAGVKTGVVHDKLWLPGLLKLKRLVEAGFFGRILSVRIEFGYWVFDGFRQPAQRPSWNYRKEEGGGIILDMFAHWSYILEGLFAPVRSISCLGAIHVAERVDEEGRRYRSTADDAAYAILELEGGIVAQVNSSWAVRVYRDDLLSIQVDGTEGSAVAGLRHCVAQHHVHTPRVVWDPDGTAPMDFRAGWQPVPDNQDFENAFKAQWKLFLRAVALDEAFPWDFLAGAKGVQLADLAYRSWRERRWLEVPELKL